MMNENGNKCVRKNRDCVIDRVSRMIFISKILQLICKILEVLLVLCHSGKSNLFLYCSVENHLFIFLVIYLKKIIRKQLCLFHCILSGFYICPPPPPTMLPFLFLLSSFRFSIFPIFLIFSHFLFKKISILPIFLI